MITGGYQTRSRAVLKAPTPGGEPCPTALWETRPCFTGACLTFNWMIGEDGQITCQRSDGVIVVGKSSEHSNHLQFYVFMFMLNISISNAV